MKIAASLLGLGAVGLSALVSLTATTQEEPTRVRTDPQGKGAFMVRKLEFMKEILAGVVAGDYELVAEHANRLGLMCLDRSWKVIETEEFVERSAAFRRTAHSLDRAALAENPDRVAFQYLRLTAQCFDCHAALRDPQR